MAPDFGLTVRSRGARRTFGPADRMSARGTAASPISPRPKATTGCDCTSGSYHRGHGWGLRGRPTITRGSSLPRSRRLGRAGPTRRHSASSATRHSELVGRPSSTAGGTQSPNYVPAEAVRRRSGRDCAGVGKTGAEFRSAVGVVDHQGTQRVRSVASCDRPLPPVRRRERCPTGR